MYARAIAFSIVVLMLISAFPVQGEAGQDTRADNELILRVAIQEDIKTLNYLSANDVWTWDVIGWVFDGLTWRNSSNNDHIEPWAAEWFHHGPNSTWATEPYADNDNNDDFLNWTVKLREGIKWHDWENQTGEDRYVMAHDVIFSMRMEAKSPRYRQSLRCLTALNPDGTTMYGRDIERNTTDGVILGVNVSYQSEYPDLPVILAESKDPLTMHFRLMAPYADFTYDTLKNPIVPERIWKEHIEDILTWSDPEALISFGPFKFDFWDHQHEISRIDTFRDYFRPEYDPITGEQKPYIDAIFFKVYGTTDAAIMALSSDKVDYIAWAIDPAFIDTINKDSHLTLVRNSDLGFFYVAFNMRKPEFGYAGYDPNDVMDGIPTYNGNYTDVGKPFRVAMAHIINKQYMVSRFLQGFGSVGTSVVSPMNSYWYNPEVKTYEYDREEAERILDEQGWNDTDGDGWRELPYRGDDEITLFTPPYEPVCTHQSTLLIETDARAVGINLKELPTNFGTMVEMIENHEFDMYMLGWSIADPTDSASAPCDLFSSYTDGDGNNYVGYHNESFDRLCEEFNSEMNMEKRRDIGYQLQDAIAEDVPYSVLYYKDVLEVYNNHLTGWVPRYGSVFNRESVMNLRYREDVDYELDLSVPKSVNGGKDATFTAYVSDRNTGDPVPRATVRFYVDDGDFSPKEVMTDMQGMAELTYHAPEMESVTEVKVSATLVVEGVDYIRTYRYMTVLPPVEVVLNMESVPADMLTVHSDIPYALDIRISTGMGDVLGPPDENGTGVVLDIGTVPEGASVEYSGYDNGTFRYSVLSHAPEGSTKYYSITISAVYRIAGSDTAAASKNLNMVVVGESPPPPPPPEEEQHEGYDYTPIAVAGLFIVAIAVASVVLLRRR